jgi:hypothetical protein
MKRRTRILVLCGALAAFLALPVARGLAQEEEPVEPLEVRVHRLVVPPTQEKLFANGLRVRASCNQDCLLFAKVQFPAVVAAELGLKSKVVGTAVRDAPANVKRWLRVDLRPAARKALAEHPDVDGRFTVRVRALP